MLSPYSTAISLPEDARDGETCAEHGAKRLEISVDQQIVAWGREIQRHEAQVVTADDQTVAGLLNAQVGERV